MLGVKCEVQLTLNRFFLRTADNLPTNHHQPFTGPLLTYMSIDAKLKEAVDEGRLVLFGGLESDSAGRCLLLHPLLAADVDSKLEADRRIGKLVSDFEQFANGGQISVSLTPFEHEDAYMGLLDPPTDGTFDIRSRDPKPGLRVFGRFARPDTFVALEWWPRSVAMKGKRKLGERNSLEYQLALIEADNRWKKALPGISPLTGGQVSDFLTFKANPVGD